MVPVVFVVDGDISVRESLELMVRCEGFTHGKLRGRYFTGHGDVPTSVQAMKAGAVEFLMKPFKHSVLLDAIRESLDRGRLAPARQMEMCALRNRYASLTRRERR